MGREPGGDGAALRERAMLDLTDRDGAPAAACRIRPALPEGTHHLPAQPSSFVGRRAELGQLQDLLREARLVTLIGSGGSGKSRLALQVAVTACTAYSDGVVFVDLAPIVHPDGVAPALVRALGLRAHPGRPPIEAVAAHLGSGRRLVVLDNCEHVIEACTALTEAVLRRCPGLTVLATSRAPLDLATEVTWRVPSLSLPGDASSCAADLGRSEAVQLFSDRARAVRVGFVVDDANAVAVAEICRRLEGIPLALELAAARVRVLGPGRIAAALQDRLSALTGAGTTVARRRTLRASVEWSHDLLTEPERVLFRRLAPFAGTFDLAAAESVGTGPGLAAHQILDQLTLLIAGALVQLHEVGGHPWFRLLEPVREYADERLTHSGEDAVTRLRHRDHFLAVAEDLAGRVVGADQDRVLDELNGHLDNLRAAFACSRRVGDTDGALRIATALFPLWRMRGRRVEGCGWLDEALADPGRTPAVRARALAARNHLEVDLVDPAVPARLDECIRLAREIGDRSLLARALIGGSAGIVRGPHRQLAVLTESLTLATECDDAETMLDAGNWLAIRTGFAGEPALGLALCAEAEAFATRCEHSYMVRSMRAMTGLLLLMQGQARSAAPIVAAAAREAEIMGDRTVGTHTIALGGWAAALGGDLDAARDACARARALADQAGDGITEMVAQLGCGMAALAQRDARAASLAFTRGRELSGGAPGCADWFGGPAAEAALAGGNLDDARRLADTAVIRTLDGFPWQGGWALAARARVALVDGQPGRAEDLAHRALALRHRIEDASGIADTLEILAIAALAAGRALEAGRLLGAAAACRQQAGCRRFGVHDDAAGAALAEARAALGTAALDAAWAEGSARSGAEAAVRAARARGGRRRRPHDRAGPE